MSNPCIQPKCNNFGHLSPRDALFSLNNCYKYAIDKNAEWRPIPGFPGYEISTVGNVRNLKSYGGKPRLLVPTLRFNKYFYVTLKNEKGVRKGIAVDRLLVSTYFEKSLCEIRKVLHLDSIRYNNQIFNLTYILW